MGPEIGVGVVVVDGSGDGAALGEERGVVGVEAEEALPGGEVEEVEGERMTKRRERRGRRSLGQSLNMGEIVRAKMCRLGGVTKGVFSQGLDSAFAGWHRVCI